MIELEVPSDVKPQIFLQRRYFTGKSTVGLLSLHREFVCHVLEDTCRRVKVQDETAIPSGIYRVILDYSDRFGFSPLILGVPQFSSIRIHCGNTAKDTRGCLLLGRYDERYPDVVTDSRITHALVMPQIQALNQKEKLFIQISGGIPAAEFGKAA